MTISYLGNVQGLNINNLYNLLQNLNLKIKFTIEHNFKELPFLDILIKNQNGQIILDIYHWPTDINYTSISRAIIPKAI